MTVTVPKWVIATVGIIAVAVVAFLIGRASNEDESGFDDSKGAAVSLDCNNVELTKAASEGEFADAVLGLGAVPPGRELLDVYQAELIDCVDLTDDGADEMIVQLMCCAGGAPVFPWGIFTQDESGWASSLIRNRIPAPKLSVSEAGVTETHGTYADGDPLCCPSGARKGMVSWDGSRFVFKPETGTSNRTIGLSGDTPESLGSLPLQTANLQDAIEHFGVPSSYFRDSEICFAEWRDIGLKIDFVDLGGDNPCGREGAVGNATVGGHEAEQADWQTNEGAAVGITKEELIDLYPEMKPGRLDFGAEPDFSGRLFYLISRPSIIGDFGTTPSLAARLDAGVVTAYELYVGAGGE